jgi:hypothetical protein
VRRVLKRALKRRWHHLAEENMRPISFFSACVTGQKPFAQWNLGPNVFNAQLPEVCDLITSLKERDKGVEMEVVDAAYWMKGCSSLGRLSES